MSTTNTTAPKMKKESIYIQQKRISGEEMFKEDLADHVEKDENESDERYATRLDGIWKKLVDKSSHQGCVELDDDDDNDYEFDVSGCSAWTELLDELNGEVEEDLPEIGLVDVAEIERLTTELAKKDKRIAELNEQIEAMRQTKIELDTVKEEVGGLWRKLYTVPFPPRPLL